MRILVVGGGGREHALCWAIAASPLCDKLWCAPGNAGIATEADCVPIAVDDLDGLVALARDRAVDLVVVGPEVPLVLGLVDRLEASGIRAFGPSAAAARLEGSKAFTKDLCARHGIPTAAARTFKEAAPAKAYLRKIGAPVVVKADGLAAGKGVVVAETLDAAKAAVDAALGDGAFGPAGATILVEECLTGPEVSCFALCDGNHVLPLAAAHDYKRALEGDRGPNTGGMGAVSPTPRLAPEMERRIYEEIIEPTVAGMAADGTPYRGVLYAGVMLTPDGPRLLEYNVRFGDPECQALLPRLRSDLVPALLAVCDGTLDSVDLRWRPDTAVCVVMANRGYPADYDKGGTIAGLEAVANLESVEVFHAGTTPDPAGAVSATGGRVLNVVGLGDDVGGARARAYGVVERVAWPDAVWRRDIGAS